MKIVDLKSRVERVILSNIVKGKFSLADRITRAFARKVYNEVIANLPDDEILDLIDSITGGLGYRGKELDPVRMSYCGSLIAWPEAIPPGGKVLEIGTGIGRTCYVATGWAKPSLYITIDNSPEILAIALYRNPISVYQKALSKEIVKICLCDAVKAVKLMVGTIKFDHIIHDGGPNPLRNPRLFSKEFLSNLYDLLRKGGSLSLFAGRHRGCQDRLYFILKSLGFKVNTVSFPDAPVLIFHARRI
ncbi:MAG: hypothetical protein DRZ82_05025 [Thermoprotei archaeon]|nr:MAG: hypothetical protein DRZ82_05025 [Thermoprotei archaeon]